MFGFEKHELSHNLKQYAQHSTHMLIKDIELHEKDDESPFEKELEQVAITFENGEKIVLNPDDSVLMNLIFGETDQKMHPFQWIAHRLNDHKMTVQEAKNKLLRLLNHD
jgi:hypothetical protein